MIIFVFLIDAIHEDRFCMRNFQDLFLNLSDPYRIHTDSAGSSGNFHDPCKLICWNFPKLCCLILLEISMIDADWLCWKFPRLCWLLVLEISLIIVLILLEIFYDPCRLFLLWISEIHATDFAGNFQQHCRLILLWISKVTADCFCWKLPTIYAECCEYPWLLSTEFTGNFQDHYEMNSVEIS